MNKVTKAVVSLPLKDWCRDCTSRDYGKECYYCLYLAYREKQMNQPPKFKEKILGEKTEGESQK